MPGDRTASPIRRAMSGSHFSPMTAEERLDEVARLLALGFLRLRARHQAKKASDPNQLSSFGLDFVAEGSVCDTDAHADRELR